MFESIGIWSTSTFQMNTLLCNARNPQERLETKREKNREREREREKREAERGWMKKRQEIFFRGILIIFHSLFTLLHLIFFSHLTS